MAICSKCSLDKDENKFLKIGDKINECCSSCIYKEKLQNRSNKIEEKKCLVCKEPVKGMRWKFCSKKCAEIGNDQKKEAYWRHKINAPLVLWRSLKL